MKSVIFFRNKNFSLFAVLLLFAAWQIACSNTKPKVEGSVSDREKTPILKSVGITTLISDSGVTRYRMTSPYWYYFDKTKEPQHVFPKGLHFDRFDTEMNVDAQIDCKRAVFFDKSEIWILRDSVRCANLSGEIFETNMLTWNMKTEKIYSDSAIKITTPTSVINGTGFESNQMFTVYHIKKVTGIVPIDNSNDTTQNTIDSTQ